MRVNARLQGMHRGVTGFRLAMLARALKTAD